MNSTTFTVLLVISNIAILVANILILMIYLYAATNSSKVYGLWFYIAAFPIYIFLGLLNLLTSFGTTILFEYIPKEAFRVLYFISLAATPLGAILGVIGAFLIARFIVKTQMQTEQDAAANP